MNRLDVNVQLSPQKTVRFLSFMVLGIIVFSVASRFCLYVLGYSGISGLLNVFYVDAERSIPTWYSSMTLLFCSCLLTVISISKQRTGDRFVRYWQGLALIFLGLSIDEAAVIHELAINQAHDILKIDAIFFAAWVIPAAILVLLFGLLYLRFWLSLPVRMRVLFAIAGMSYVGGALGAELLGGIYAKVYGVENFAYSLIATLEELGEMAGVLIFIYALLTYLNAHCKPLSILLNSGSPP